MIMMMMIMMIIIIIIIIIMPCFVYSCTLDYSLFIYHAVEWECCNSGITVESGGNAECKMDSEEEAQRGKEKYWS